MRISRTTRSCTFHSQSYGTRYWAFVWMYSRCFRSCRLMGVFISSPLPPVLAPSGCAARPLRSADVTPLHRYYGPSRHRLAFGRLPGCASYTTDRLHRFLDGARTASPVAQHVLVTVLSLTTPPECYAASVSLRRTILPSPRTRGLGLRSYFLSRPPLGSLMLWPGDSLTILSMALSVGFIRFVSSTDATQVTGL